MKMYQNHKGFGSCDFFLIAEFLKLATTWARYQQLSESEPKILAPIIGYVRATGNCLVANVS